MVMLHHVMGGKNKGTALLYVRECACRKVNVNKLIRKRYIRVCKNFVDFLNTNILECTSHISSRNTHNTHIDKTCHTTCINYLLLFTFDELPGVRELDCFEFLSFPFCDIDLLALEDLSLAIFGLLACLSRAFELLVLN